MRLTLLLALAPACVDYGLEKVPPVAAIDTGLASEPLCPVEEEAASPLALVDGCADPGFPDGVDAFTLEIEWQEEGFMALMLPVVGLLSDDDIPDIVVVEWVLDLGAPAILRAFSGDGAGELFQAEGFDSNWGPAIADVDGDGDNEVLGMTPDYRVRALGPTGEVEWTSDKLPPAEWGYFGHIVVADFEGDGAAEVIAGGSVLAGADGTLLNRVLADDGVFTPVVADVDLDGRQDLLMGAGVWDIDGTLHWETDWPLVPDCTPAVGQLDEDEEAEVVFICYGEVNVHEHDGEMIWTKPLPRPQANNGMPCIGDITGDGAAELIVPNGIRLVAWDRGGTELWQTEIIDSTSAAGCALFDMDGDGANEVLYGDEYELSVIDGRTGARLFEDPSRGSATGYDYPVIADVDQDGAAEIVVVATGTYGGYQGLAVYGHPYGLPGAGPAWPSHDYDTLKIDDRGHVVEDPEPFWLAHNLFHGRGAVERPADADLVVQVDTVCAEGCAADSVVHVRFRVGNQGPMDVDSARVTLTVQGEAGPEVLREVVLGPLPSGQLGATRSWTLQRAAFKAGEVTLSVSPTAQVECGAADNVAVIPAPPCEEG
ncbi:MAG: VCBS repeat-containing protein [Alphaproteobacteria bacterium]|nr:VCBS repeat-containing protein [Alphaproteobacteria bacterium]